MTTIYFSMQKKSVYFAFGDLHLRASKAEMYIGEEKIAWISVCNYIGVGVPVCSGNFLKRIMRSGENFVVL